MVVTDIDQARLDRAAHLYSLELAKIEGIDLRYINTRLSDAVAHLKEISGGERYNDVFAIGPVAPVIEQADQLWLLRLSQFFCRSIRS